jgi:hypothetical protein
MDSLHEELGVFSVLRSDWVGNSQDNLASIVTYITIVILVQGQMCSSVERTRIVTLCVHLLTCLLYIIDSSPCCPQMDSL